MGMKSLTVILCFLVTAFFVIPSVTTVTASGMTVTSPMSFVPGSSPLSTIPIVVPPGKLGLPGFDIRVTNNVSEQNEVSVAINPTDTTNLIIGANDQRGWNDSGVDYWCGVYTSVDSGATWTMGLIPHTGALAWDYAAGDPSVAFDLNGNAYFTCLGFVRGSVITNNTIAVSKSIDGGFTWQPPVALVNAPSTPPFHDKPYMAVDVSISSPYQNNIYVSWTNFTTTSGGPSPIYFSRSTDGGAGFSTPMLISGSQLYCQGSQPSVGPNGEVYVSFISYFGGSSALYVTKSLDGGATFNTPVKAADVVDPGDLPQYRRTPTIPSSATDSSSGPYSGSVYVVWQDGAAGNHDILLSYSRDGGSTWSTPTRVNDVAMNAQFFPFVSVAPSGRVDVVFYDRRNDPADRLLDVYAGISFDGGVTFKNKRITDNSMNTGMGRPFIGDYIGIASLPHSFYPGWCGFVGTDTEIFTERTLAPRFVAVPN